MLVQLIIIQVITFVAIVFVLRKFLYTETARETGRLKALKEENTRKERELAGKIAAAEGAYREKVEEAEKDIRRLREKAAEDARRDLRRSSEEAKAEAERILNEALNAREKIRDEVLRETRKKIPSISSGIIKEILSEEAKEFIHKELVSDVARSIAAIDGTGFSVSAKKAELVSAFPLTKEEKNRLVSALSRKAGAKVSCEEKNDKKLVAGVMIKMGTLVIDGTLENRLRDMVGRLAG